MGVYMLITLMVLFEDGHEDWIGSYGDVAEAITDALKLADDLGREPENNGSPPDRVRVYNGSSLEFSAKVVQGGLASKADVIPSNDD